MIENDKQHTDAFENAASQPQKPYLPLFMHRWFENGGGWTYHPDLKDRINNFSEILTDPLHREGPREFILPAGKDECLIGVWEFDYHCLDEMAIGRRPFILQAALADKKLNNQENTQKIFQFFWKRLLENDNAKGRGQSIPQKEGPLDSYKLTYKTTGNSATSQNPKPSYE